MKFKRKKTFKWPTFLDTDPGAAGAWWHAAGHFLFAGQLPSLVQSLGRQTLADQYHHHLHHLADQCWRIAKSAQPLYAGPVNLAFPDDDLLSEQTTFQNLFNITELQTPIIM